MAITRLLFLATIALIPVQLNKFFWPNFSFVFGIPIDYLAPSIYLSEILAFLFISSSFIFQRKNMIAYLRRHKSLTLSLTVLCAYFLISPLFSQSQVLSLFFGLKLSLASLFFIASAYELTKIKTLNLFTKVIAFSIIWQLLLVAIQFINQKSLGLIFLGERSFDSTTTAIAQINIFGRYFLRPYGSFSHPNTVAAFFAISALFLLLLKKVKFIVIIGLVGGLLTFSKSFTLAIFTTAVALNINRIRYLIPILIIAVPVLTLVFLYASNFQIATFTERLDLFEAAITIAQNNIIFGVGSSNFIEHLANLDLFSLREVRLLQPVHNIFFLILAENGTIGLALFLFFLIQIAKYVKTTRQLSLFVVLLVFASLDHFFWTLTQGRLLFFLALAFLIVSPKTASMR